MIIKLGFVFPCILSCILYFVAQEDCCVSDHRRY